MNIFKMVLIVVLVFGLVWFTCKSSEADTDSRRPLLIVCKDVEGGGRSEI
jgi:hypothetical protein